MKIFWSWQSDTPGKVGRHFTRAVLAKAIEELKEAEDVEEPSAREAHEALHLDHDRQGVSGSQDLALTIFRKIDESAVFIADVTLVADVRDGEGDVLKKLINSNVAIEYGYALKALSDTRVLAVQNTYFGGREELPFDLRHKAGPLQYRLAPGATKAEIETEAKKLCSIFVAALRPYLAKGRSAAAPEAEPFQEIRWTRHRGMFWQPSDILAVAGETPLARALGRPEEDRVEYRFNEPHVFYLRLIPTTALPRSLNVTSLVEIVESRQVQLLTQNAHATLNGRNEFGAIAYEPQGTGTAPLAFAQLFRNGEIWGTTSTFVVQFENKLVVPMVTLTKTYHRIVLNFMKVAVERMGVQLPYAIELAGC
jgi:hypothetical protein